jgi:hypothetical protein
MGTYTMPGMPISSQAKKVFVAFFAGYLRLPMLIDSNG